ncbi:MAG: hypothetical protein WBO17_06505, partial [Sphingorhabdus sp.]
MALRLYQKASIQHFDVKSVRLADKNCFKCSSDAQNLVETRSEACYEYMRMSDQNALSIRGELMNYRNSIRLLQASAFLGICMPALAQDVPPPPPIQEPIPNQDPEPELQNEQVTNEPVVEPGPVIAPEAAPVPVKPATVSPKKKEPVDSLKP